MVSAVAGQGATQAPQPLQRVLSIIGVAWPPTASRNTMARRSHESAQVRQITPAVDRHVSPTVGLAAHGAEAGAGSEAAPAGANAPAPQARTQAPQKVQGPRAKLTTG